MKETVGDMHLYVYRAPTKNFMCLSLLTIWRKACLLLFHRCGCCSSAKGHPLTRVLQRVSTSEIPSRVPLTNACTLSLSSEVPDSGLAPAPRGSALLWGEGSTPTHLAWPRESLPELAALGAEGIQ